MNYESPELFLFISLFKNPKQNGSKHNGNMGHNGKKKKNRFLLQQQKDDMGNKAPTPKSCMITYAREKKNNRSLLQSPYIYKQHFAFRKRTI